MVIMVYCRSLIFGLCIIVVQVSCLFENDNVLFAVGKILPTVLLKKVKEDKLPAKEKLYEGRIRSYRGM